MKFIGEKRKDQRLNQLTDAQEWHFSIAHVFFAMVEK